MVNAEKELERLRKAVGRYLRSRAVSGGLTAAQAIERGRSFHDLMNIVPEGYWRDPDECGCDRLPSGHEAKEHSL